MRRNRRVGRVAREDVDEVLVVAVDTDRESRGQEMAHVRDDVDDRIGFLVHDRPVS